MTLKPNVDSNLNASENTKDKIGNREDDSVSLISKPSVTSMPNDMVGGEEVISLDRKLGDQDDNTKAAVAHADDVIAWQDH